MSSSRSRRSRRNLTHPRTARPWVALPTHEKLFACCGGPSSTREGHRLLRRAIVYSGGPSSTREGHPLLARVIVYPGGPSSAPEAHPLLGRAILCPGGPSSAREAHPLPGRPILCSGGPSSAREDHPLPGRAILCSGGPSSAPEAHPALRRAILCSGGSSHAPEAPPSRPKPLTLARGPASASVTHLRPERAPDGVAVPPRKIFFRTLRTKSFGKTPRKQRRRDRATPDGPVGCPGSWPPTGRGETPWYARHPGCPRRSRRRR